MPRPSFRVKEEDRKLVRSLAALGLRQDQIIETVGLRSPKTLRKHFRAELHAGLAEATFTVARVAYEMAISGRYPQMTIFWDKCNRISGEDPEEEPKEKKDKRPQARTSSGGFVFLPPKKAADAA
jgi:hypothetical protein